MALCRNRHARTSWSPKKLRLCQPLSDVASDAGRATSDVSDKESKRKELLDSFLTIADTSDAALPASDGTSDAVYQKRIKKESTLSRAKIHLCMSPQRASNCPHTLMQWLLAADAASRREDGRHGSLSEPSRAHLVEP